MRLMGVGGGGEWFDGWMRVEGGGWLDEWMRIESSGWVNGN